LVGDAVVPAYAGEVLSPWTLTQVPFCRTWTVRERNHPPSQKCIPSWKTTRVKVRVPEKV